MRMRSLRGLWGRQRVRDVTYEMKTVQVPCAEVTMLPDNTIQRLAAELYASEKSRCSIEQFSKRYPEMTIEDGYAISRAWVKTKINEGDVVKGRKIGLTSR